jgi:hypothetical protein
MHEALGGAFPKRHHVDYGLITVICKVPFLGRHTALWGATQERELERGAHEEEKRVPTHGFVYLLL